MTGSLHNLVKALWYKPEGCGLDSQCHWNFQLTKSFQPQVWALRSTQPLTEMSTRNPPGGKGRPACKADNLPIICKPTVWKMWGNLDLSQPYEPPQPVIGMALPFFLSYL
jgi:hypothetical protein